MTDLLMPKLGLTMTEGVLLEWKVAPGEAFSKGQLIFVVESDKAATEIEAEADGVVAERLVGEGETVPVGTPVARLGGKASAAAAREAPPASAVRNEAAARGKEPLIPAPKSNGGARVVATPLARRLARERGIDLAAVTGSGPRGRIKAVDLEGARPAAAGDPGAPRLPGSTSRPGHTRSKPTPTQAAMARRLSQVKHGVPHFYLAVEVEVSALIKLRAELNADSEQPKLTLNHFVLAAVGRALKARPGINRVWDDGDIVAYQGTDVSMAVETQGGLYVPVVRDAGTAGLDAVAASARAMIDKAKAGRLSAAEMEGAAIAVSNAGMHDVTWLTPIINAGQSAIIGVGSIREVFRPDDYDQPVLRREMGLVFSGDHRVHTGVEGLAFLNHVKILLQNPMRLLRHG